MIPVDIATTVQIHQMYFKLVHLEFSQWPVPLIDWFSSKFIPRVLVLQSKKPVNKLHQCFSNAFSSSCVRRPTMNLGSSITISPALIIALSYNCNEKRTYPMIDIYFIIN